MKRLLKFLKPKTKEVIVKMNSEVKLEGSVHRALKALTSARELIKKLSDRNDCLEAKVAELTALIDAEVPEDTGGSTGGVIG